MRNGRPCNCGCVECTGFGCSIQQPDLSCDADGIVYLSLYEPFSDPLQSGWITGQVAQSGGLGVASSGNTLIDYINGSGLRDPLICARASISCTVFTDNKNEGFATFGLGGGPYFTIEGSNVEFALPSGSIIVDDAYQSGDRYGAYLGINYIPSGFYRNEIKVYKYRNGTGFACNPPLEGSGFGAGESSIVTPYPTGCVYTQCLLYENTFNERDGDTVYNIQSPATAGISESGTWKFDDFCVNFWDRYGERMLPGGFSLPIINEETCVCTYTDPCDFILDKPWFTWRIPCPTEFDVPGSGSYLEPMPCSSGQDPYLIWQAYDDEWLRDTNSWRCDNLVPGSSVVVLLKTETTSYNVDLNTADIWHLIPLVAIESYSCEDSNPFDGTTDCETVTFSGYPCRDNDCYSYPFGSFDNIYTTYYYGVEFNSAGNVFYIDSNCLQAGGVDYSFGSGVPQSPSSYTIPRDDDYSIIRYADGQLNLTAAHAWKVEKIAYGLNFDETNRWWYGNFRFLNASGSTWAGAGGSGSPTYFDGVDLSILYSSGTCDLYDLYIYQRCGLESTDPVIEILGSGNSVFSSDIFYNYDVNNLLDPVTDFHESSTIQNNGSVSFNKGLMYCDNGVIEPNGEIVNICDISRFYNIGPEDQVVCASGACIDPSGTYSLSLRGKLGYVLSVSGFDNPTVPHILIDQYGSCVTRDVSQIADGNWAGGAAGQYPSLLGFGVPYNPNDYPGATCINVNDAKIYELLGSETVDLMWPATQKASVVGMTLGCGGTTNIPYWQGTVVGKVTSLGDGAFDWLTGVTFASGDYDSTGAFCKYNIAPVGVSLFLDKNNSNLKGQVRVCGGLPHYDSMSQGGGSESDWYVEPSGYYKSESDMLNGDYFATIDLLSTSPLKIKMTQTFMAFGVPNMGDLDESCERYKLYPYLIEVTLEEPIII